MCYKFIVYGAYMYNRNLASVTFSFMSSRVAFKALQSWLQHSLVWLHSFSIILLSTFTKQINDAVVRNLRRVSHVNLLVNFKNKQYCGCCQLKCFPLLYSKCQSSIIVYLPIPLGKLYHAPIHKTSKNKHKTEYMIVGSRQ
jgi:hypothetical protein